MGDFERRPNFISTRSTLELMLKNRIIPVVNENDVVSDQEIRLMEKGWGENDLLAARVACLVKARFVAFLSSVGGGFEKKPEKGNGISSSAREA